MIRTKNAAYLTLFLGFTLTSACGEAVNDSGISSEYVENMANESPNVANDAMAGDTIGDEAPQQPLAETAQPISAEISLPKLAYVYDFAFSLDGGELRKLQRRHASLCEQQGPTSCQIIGMQTQGELGDDINGDLQMLVATRHARAFGALLEDEALDAGAEQKSANIQTEELTKSLVDTEAGIETGHQLREQLKDIRRNQSANMQERIEAERAIAAVNKEIEQASRLMAQLENRVEFSRVNVAYATPTGAGRDFASPIEDVFASLGSIMGYIVAIMIFLLAVLTPIGLALFGLKRAHRLFGQPDMTEEG